MGAIHRNSAGDQPRFVPVRRCGADSDEYVDSADSDEPPTTIPPTNTAIPPTLPNSRGIASVRLSSANPGELSVVWDAPGEPARDYRVSWAKVGEAFRTWTDLDYNAFPTAASLTISGLDGGSRYKVMVRARYVGAAGPWTGEVEADVMVEASLATPTNTAVPPTNTSVPPTNTSVPPTNTLVPPTNTLVPDVGPREIEFVVLNGDPNGAIDVSWPVPSEFPVDYRINWAVESENYPTWTDSSGNAFPAVNAYTITGLVRGCLLQGSGAGAVWRELPATGRRRRERSTGPASA